MLRRDEVRLVFNDSEPTVLVRVRDMDVAMLVLPGLGVPRPGDYDGYFADPLPGETDPAGPGSGVAEEGEFLLATWRNRPDDGAMEEYVRLHKGRWDKGTA